MLSRVGFLGRVILIVLALLLAFAALSITVSFIAREQRETGSESFPIPAQAAAIVELIDATDAAGRERVLKAVSSETFFVRLVDAVPQRAEEDRRMPGVEWLVGQYLEELPERTVVAFRATDTALPPGRRWLGRVFGTVREPVVIAIALKGAGFVLIEVRGDGTRRLFGIPVGFWIGMFGFLAAAAALWAIAREARPLRDLSEAASRFAVSGEPQALKVRGATEIRRLITATNEMQARVSALIKGRTMLLGAISHDLKTYITRLRLRAEGLEPASQRDGAIRDLDDMTDLINDALAVARGATVSERRERFRVADLISDEVARRQDPAITFSATTVARSAVVSGDELALQRVAANLIDNARRYGRTCRVGLDVVAEAVEFVVEDDGPGIPEAERLAVFEPFYRLEQSRNRSTGGSGLGLAIAKQIVEAHGGTIAVDHSNLGGARMIVRLPLQD